MIQIIDMTTLILRFLAPVFTLLPQPCVSQFGPLVTVDLGVVLYPLGVGGYPGVDPRPVLLPTAVWSPGDDAAQHPDWLLANLLLHWERPTGVSLQVGRMRDLTAGCWDSRHTRPSLPPCTRRTPRCRHWRARPGPPAWRGCCSQSCSAEERQPRSGEKSSDLLHRFCPSQWRTPTFQSTSDL